MTRLSRAIKTWWKQSGVPFAEALGMVFLAMVGFWVLVQCDPSPPERIVTAVFLLCSALGGCGLAIVLMSTLVSRSVIGTLIGLCLTLPAWYYLLFVASS
jgi:hypothetical protein